MSMTLRSLTLTTLPLLLLFFPPILGTINGTDEASPQNPTVGTSPWGPEDEIGRLNLMTAESRAEILSRVSGGTAYDLSVDYYIGMPSWQAAGDPHYRMWMTHTPQGTVVDDPMGLGEEMNEHVSYTGAAISMYTHMGTHIDALSHFGLNGKIWNGFSAAQHLGDRGWNAAGASSIPPIIARGVLIDVATAKGLEMLPNGYRVTRDDLVEALDRQGVQLLEGDIVLIRTGRMKIYEDAAAYMDNPPGLGMEAARFLVEEKGAMIVGADNLSLEAFPSEVANNYVPLHTYLLAEQGAPILELVYLEELARDGVYEFAFLGGSLKLRGADAAPIRPIAIPLRPLSEANTEVLKTAVNPAHLPNTTQYGYSQATVAASDARLIHVAGQIGVSEEGPNDFRHQVDRSFDALVAVLQAAGAQVEDVVKITLLIRDHDDEKLQYLVRKRREVFGDNPPASTLIPVTALALESLEFEVDAVAVIR
jgi:kynurenine formamidase